MLKNILSSSISSETTFIEKCLMGTYVDAASKLDEEIKSWCKSETCVSLQDWLGLTDEEFKSFTESDINTKRSCFISILLNRMLLDNKL